MKLKEFGLPGAARPSRPPPPIRHTDTHTHTHTHTHREGGRERESPNVDTVQIHGSCSAQVADGNFCQLCIFYDFHVEGHYVATTLNILTYGLLM